MRDNKTLTEARRLIADGMSAFDAVAAAARQFAGSDSHEVKLRNDVHAALSAEQLNAYPRERP